MDTSFLVSKKSYPPFLSHYCLGILKNPHQLLSIVESPTDLWGAYYIPNRIRGTLHKALGLKGEQLYFVIVTCVKYFVFYLFGCTRSYLWHVGSTSLTRAQTQAPCIGSMEP